MAAVVLTRDEILNAATKYNFALRKTFDLKTVAVAETGTDASGGTAGAVDTSNERKEYTRPNGQLYIPREMTINGQRVQDVTFIKLAHAQHMPVLLYGDPGTGKTALIEAALPDLVTLQGTIETEVADFVGSWTQQTDGTYKWVDGPLPIAMENGLPFLIDEVALIDPRVMAVVYGVMDGRDELVVTANPERGTVKVNEGFMVYGSCNPDVPGAVMSDALLSRFQFHIEVTTDWSLTKKLGIDSRIVQVARNLNLKKNDHTVTSAPQLRELLTFKEVNDAFGLDLALRNFISQTRSEDRTIVLEVVESVFGTKPNALTL
jgi:nitric oxide reductase NorQ protein